MKQFSIFLVGLLTICSCNMLYAQADERGKIDSMMAELPRQKEDTNKVNLLNKLSRTFNSAGNPDTGIIYAAHSMKLAAKLHWKKGLAYATNLMGVNYADRSNYPVALGYYSKALEMYREMGYKPGITGVIRNMGTIYTDQGAYYKALDLYFEGIKIAEQAGDKQELGYLATDIATIYANISNYPKALEYAFRALRTDEEIGDKNGIGRALLVIGSVYTEKGDYQASREYYQKALKIYEEMDIKGGMAAAITNVGITYTEMGDHAAALEYYFKAMQIQETIGDRQQIADMKLYIGAAYLSMGDYSRALAYESEALRTEEDLGARPNAAYILGIIGDIYLSMVKDSTRKPVVKSPEIQYGKYKGKDIPDSKKEQLRLAIHFLERARDSSAALGVLDVLKESNGNLSEAYGLAGLHEKALDAYGEYVKIKDSVFNMESEKKIVQQQLKYDYGKREDSIKLATAEREKANALQYQRQRSYTLMGAGGILVLALCSVFMFRNNKLLTKEKTRSENLLLNILPVEVADELKNTGSAKARHFDNVTVLFTDFVNFIEAGGRMSPQGLIDELHTCFRAFDEITHKYNIEKIKTIGDAYLAICGLPSPDPEHAANVIRAAIEINAFMEDRLAKLGSERTFAIRIGVHSGSVIAGIVGVKKFAYDIWGDTVNTAARMEQNSIAGRINISSTTYDLVKDKFICEYRGEVEVKGKGVMQMYFAGQRIL